MCILQCGYQHPVSDSAREAGPRGVHQRRAFSSFRRSLAAWSDWPSEFQARMPATLVASGCCEALTHFACFVDDSLSALPATRPDCNRGTKVCFVWTMPIVSFQLPTSCAPIMKPSSMSVRRDMPLHITMLPGGESLARAR